MGKNIIEGFTENEAEKYRAETATSSSVSPLSLAAKRLPAQRLAL
jgi:hypothetical protein